MESQKKIIKRLFIAFIVFGILYAAIRPMYSDYSIRTKTSEMLIVTSGMKSEIEKALLAKRPISTIDPLTFKPYGAYTTQVDVTESGKIIIFSEPLSTYISLTPKLSGNKITWSCYGYPTINVSVGCRDKAP